MLMQITTTAPTDTRALAARLGPHLRPGHLIALQGELGSGKTTFAAGLAAGWGAREPATSPTYVIIHQYTRADGQRLYHADAYRLATLADAESAGLLDLLEQPDGALILEWPEHLATALPTARLTIAFTLVDDNTRQLTFTASDPDHAALLTHLAQ